jgi:hypothetical protein
MWTKSVALVAKAGTCHHSTTFATHLALKVGIRHHLHHVTMRFWTEKALRYNAVNSNDEDTSLEPQTNDHRGFSRLALIAIIIIAQVLVLASSNIAAYTLGKTRSQEHFTTIPRVVQSASVGGPKGLLLASHNDIPSVNLR